MGTSDASSIATRSCHLAHLAPAPSFPRPRTGANAGIRMHPPLFPNAAGSDLDDVQRRDHSVLPPNDSARSSPWLSPPSGGPKSAEKMDVSRKGLLLNVARNVHARMR